MTTFSSLTPSFSAITFSDVRSSIRTEMRAVDPGAARASPSANEAPTTGTVRGPDGRACGGRSGDVDQRTRAVGRVALVEDDHRASAGGLRVVSLQGEAAPTPLDEGDRTCREAGEVVHARSGRP